MNTYKPSGTYFSNLDIFRFFLAITVVLYHIPTISKNMGLPYFDQLPIFNRGIEAVYSFFVLSGFLLSHLAKKEMSTGRFNLIRFFYRRILRIWPLYFLVSFFGIFFYYFILPALHIPFQNNASLSTALLLTITFLSNILHAWYDPGGILTITWSVSVEEQFYLLFPFLVLFIYKHTILKKIITSLLFVLVCYIEICYPTLEQTANDLGLFIELFLLGIIAEEFIPFFTIINRYLKKIFFFFSCLFVAVLFFTDLLHNQDQVIKWRLINGLAAAILILSLVTIDGECKIKWLTMGGKISYGIYMYHMIVITGVVFLFGKIPFWGIWTVVLINLIVLVLSYTMALFSYRYFEAKFLKLKKY